MFLKRSLPLFFFLVLSLPGGDLLAAPGSDPATWAERTVSPALQLPQEKGEEAPSPLIATPTSLAPAGAEAGIAAAVPPVLAGESASNVVSDETAAVSEEDDFGSEALPLRDPAAIEESKILTEAETAPPEDEGATVVVTELQFDFPVVENQKVQYYIDYFTGPGRNAFTRWMERSTRYLPYMQEVFAGQGLPRDLAYLSIVESGLNPKAYSWAHASGPWQFIPSTGKIFGLESDYWWDERRDFEKSTEAAALFLKELYGLFNGNWYLAVASYNAGPGAVARAVERSGSSDFWALAHGSYLPEETKNYIPKLLAVLLIAKQPERYGFSNTQFLSPIACDKAMIAGPTDLAVVARLAGSSYDEIKALNPELKRWCTPPQQESYELNLPLGSREAFLTAYDLLPVGERSNYTVHRVAKGETLKSLAREYRLKSEEILRANFLSSAKGIKAGRNLVIPLRPGVEVIPREDLFEDPVTIKVVKSRTYRVQKGDTLSKISRRSGVPLAQLKSWNRLTERNRLRVGQVILVGPGKKSSRPALAAAKASTRKRTAEVREKTGGRIVYKVKKGDTILKIARQYAVPPARLLSWNGLGQQHILQPGESLTLRVGGRKGG